MNFGVAPCPTSSVICAVRVCIFILVAPRYVLCFVSMLYTSIVIVLESCRPLQFWFCSVRTLVARTCRSGAAQNSTRKQPSRTETRSCYKLYGHVPALPKCTWSLVVPEHFNCEAAPFSAPNSNIFARIVRGKVVTPIKILQGTVLVTLVKNRTNCEFLCRKFGCTISPK